MIPLIVVTHGNLAKEFVKALEHVVGKQDQIFPFCIHSEDAIDKKRKELLKLVKNQESDKGVIILTDMFGGTPSNLAISLLDLGNIEVVAGVNLPMLIKLVSLRDKVSLKEAVAEAQEAARKYINVATQLLAKTA